MSPAVFSVELELPDGSEDAMQDVRQAIRTEHRGAAELLSLRCRRVEPVGDTGIYRLIVGRSLPVDWTWEGSVAYAPAPALGEEEAWRGQVLEVDDMDGALYVAVEADHPPQPGEFIVRPFDFLVALNHIYNGQEIPEAVSTRLCAHVLATRGGLHPVVDHVGERPAGLAEVWEHAWSVLWGPPGTGKTHQLGELVANALRDPNERVLVVSTTNRATDEAALSVVRAVRARDPETVLSPSIIRVGSGARFSAYANRGAGDVLAGGEVDLRRALDGLRDDLRGTRDPERRAELNRAITQTRAAVRSATVDAVRDAEHRVVVATMFMAGNLLRNTEVIDALSEHNAPFTTVVIDEAGLVSRAAVAALALLAARRVVLVGDPRQLSPISKMCRALNTNQAMWLAESAVGHLRSPSDCVPGVQLLESQFRMAPDIRAVVSKLTYEDRLSDAPEVESRDCPLPQSLADGPRAIWYVLDETVSDTVRARAERAPGGRGWVREAGRSILDRVFRAHPDLVDLEGLYVTPFSAQAKQTAGWLGEQEHTSWTASTVHKQQGTQFDVVVFDTVHASGTSWPYEEWRRLVNVGLSRAKHLLVVIASRDEMTMPFLSGLTTSMQPRVLNRRGSRWDWEVVDADVSPPPMPDVSSDPALIGAQLVQRRLMRPVLSADQERLCRLRMDGKPRLVRGVAGSGKTLVLAHWLSQVLLDRSDTLAGKIWVVFGNRSLTGLLTQTIEAGWERLRTNKSLPWHRVELLHIRDVLSLLYREAQRPPPKGFDYEQMARWYFQAVTRDQVRPRCDAMFIDEAQDMGHDTLDLLVRLTRAVEHDGGEGQAIHIFYDNAQNLYGRSTPTWSELGLDMRGRSTVMKESFRSTREISEFATNVLYRIQDPKNDEDYRELVSRNLVERREIQGRAWWSIHYNRVSGPPPDFRVYPTRVRELRAVAEDAACLIRDEGVSPQDICVLYNGLGRRHTPELERSLNGALRPVGARAVLEKNQARFTRRPDTVLITTPHSFKGYEAEVIFVVGLDRFVARDAILASNVYVACTRARTLLRVSAAREHLSAFSRLLIQTAEEVLDDQYQRVPDNETRVGALNDLIDVLGEAHRGWVEVLDERYGVRQLPLQSPAGAVMAEPLFWVDVDGVIRACFGGESVSRRVLHELEDAGVALLSVGEEL